MKFSRLKQIIAEELKVANADLDADGIKNVVNLAAKLLKSAKEFKAGANSAMLNAVTPQLDDLIKTSEAMMHQPSSYLPLPPAVRKKKTVQLRKQEKSLI